jgi:O-acetyl-ADP-ribose deacetylase (regulator of RNase III)/ADP-ribose pyrophosphatase YjhB (NUDIX family)
MRINNTELKIIKGDITELEVGAIVNSANNKLLMSSGLAEVIRKKGGQIIEDEATQKGPLKIGEAVETSAGLLKAKYVIHAAVMKRSDDIDETNIRDACRNSLEVAKRLKLKSIAFPALGCGVAGFPAKACAKIMSQEILKHAKYDPEPINEIIFVLYDDKTFDIFRTQTESYLEYMQHKLSQGPFITVDIIIEVKGGLVLIERSNPPFGWAIPGGFLDYGETLEKCAIREAKEETNLDIYDLEQMFTYSDPRRDPRFHTVTTVFVAKANGTPKAGDDAQDAKVVSLDEVRNLKLAFDHHNVLEDYQRFKQKRK